MFAHTLHDENWWKPLNFFNPKSQLDKRASTALPCSGLQCWWASGCGYHAGELFHQNEIPQWLNQLLLYLRNREVAHWHIFLRKTSFGSSYCAWHARRLQGFLLKRGPNLLHSATGKEGIASGAGARLLFLNDDDYFGLFWSCMSRPLRKNMLSVRVV